MTMRLERVGAGHIQKLMLLIEKYLRPAVGYGDGCYTLGDVVKLIYSNEWQLWMIYNDEDVYGFLVTEIRKYPNQKRMTILFLGGKKMESWLHLLEDVKAYAKEQKCHVLQIFGRRGWLKKLPDYGFEQTHTLMRVNLWEAYSGAVEAVQHPHKQ